MSLSISLSKILIIDFGSQFTQLIARRIRELGVFSEIISHKKINSREIIKRNIVGIILSGGPLNVYESHKFNFDKKIKSKSFDNILKNIGKNSKLTNYFIKLADKGINF